MAYSVKYSYLGPLKIFLENSKKIKNNIKFFIKICKDCLSIKCACKADLGKIYRAGLEYWILKTLESFFPRLI